MIIIAGMWEKDWMDPRQEKYMWRACKSLGADKIFMFPNRGYQSLNDLFKNYPSYTKIFLESEPHPQAQNIYNYIHPKNAIYIFGNNSSGNTNKITPDDDVIHINLDEKTYPWAITIVGIVLYDRRFKLWQSQ